MSIQLHQYAEAFLADKVPAEAFGETDIERGKEERDSGISINDSPNLSEVLSAVFCLADL